MGIEATTKDYWIAPNAVSIILNALGDANRIQGNVASGAVVSCYIESIGPGGENGDGLRLDNGRNPKRWPLSFSPTFFNSDSEKYVYAAIPRRVKARKSGLSIIFMFSYGASYPSLEGTRANEAGATNWTSEHLERMRT